MKFKPLRHGERVVYTAHGGVPVRGRVREPGRVVEPARALRENWLYGSLVFDESNEGVSWARGWNTKAAKALRVACAL